MILISLIENNREQEIKQKEYTSELETVQKMYSAPKEEAAPTI